MSVSTLDDTLDGEVIGCIGSPWRASVGPGGDLQPWDDSAALRWYIAADDRWYVPTDETEVEQRRIDGTPVIETKVRIPRGEAIQRVYATMNGGGATVVEITNRSTLPIAVAFSRSDLLSARQPTDVPIQGIDLPPGSVTFPVGHRASITVALAHQRPAAGPLPAGLPAADRVSRGWLTTCAQASSMDLPDLMLSEAVIEARCAALLEPIADPDRHPAEFLVTLGELVRLGEPVDPWLADVVVAAERVLRSTSGSWAEHTAIEATRRILAAAEEDRAGRDVVRSMQRWSAPGDRPPSVPAGIWTVPWTEQMLVDNSGALFPNGLPTIWAGINFEAHHLPIGTNRISFAVRWHGPRPALLWETDGPIALRSPVLAPEWSTTETQGEALWPEFSR